MAYDTTEAVAKFLSGFQMKITNRERDTVAPDYYVKYSLTLSKGGKDFSTTFVSDGEPTVTQVFSALADDALTLRKYSTDEFVDKLYAQGVKPSAALRAYDSCKETNLWMQDELYLSGWEIEEISKTLTKYEDEVNTLVEKAASERAARYAYDHPKLPKGFVTIEQLQGDLDLGDLRDEVEDFDFDGDITEAFGETAEYKVDDNYHALLTWLPDHTEWLDADEILNDLSYDEDYAPTDDAKDTIMGAVSAAFEERYGEDFAEVATDFGQDIDDIVGRANPYVLSVDTVRAVNEKGYDAVFAEQWKAELSECDTGAYPSRCVSSPMRASAFGDSSITRIICPSKGLPPWESTMRLAMRTGSSTTSITARNSAPPLVTWNSPSDALLRNTRKRKGRSLTTSPPANGVCILSTPESVTVSMVA